MNRKDRSYQPEYATKNRAAIRTMNLQVAVTEPDLQRAVRAAFDLAKSSGRELDLAFSLHSTTQGIPNQSKVGVSKHTLP